MKRIRDWAGEVRRARLASGLRQEHVASVLKRSQSWVARIEAGDILIGEEIAKRILKAIQVLEDAARTPAAADLCCLALPRIGKRRQGF